MCIQYQESMDVVETMQGPGCVCEVQYETH